MSSENLTQDMTFEEKHLLAWKAGLTYTRPLASAFIGLREKGLVTAGDIMSSEITPAGRAALQARKGGDHE